MERNHNRSVRKLIRRKGFRTLLGLSGTYKGLYAIVLVLQLGVTASALLFAETNRRLFDRMPGPGGELYGLLACFVAFIAMGLLFGLLERVFNQIVNTNVVFRMRELVLIQLTRLSLSHHENKHSSDSKQLLFGDLEAFKQFVVFDVLKLCTLPISFISVGIYLMTVHPVLGLIAIVVGPLQLLSSVLVNRTLKGLIARQREHGGEVFFHMGETLSGMREIKMNQMEGAVASRFRRVCDDGIRLWVAIEKLHAYRELVRAIPEKAGYIVGIGVGAVMMANGQIGAGGLVAFITLLDKASAPFASIVQIINSLQRVAAGAEKLLDVMEMEPEDDGGGIGLPPGAPSITFERVGFAYEEGRTVLSGVSFHVPAGATVALVGPSGGGKSTVVKLLYRFYAPSSGTIKLNGVPLQHYAIPSLRANLASVSQDVYLFDGTIGDNIKIGAEHAGEADVRRAAELSQSLAFIKKQPQSFDTRVGERGIRLSQGQKQRIAIARAILRKASIVVLDEPTSALDVETESMFQSDLHEWAGDCTKIVIAHRLSTIRDADYVVFLEDGEVREAGTPQELLREGGRFADFWQKQEIKEFVS
ncbi:ABC transporter ATP-binding protein [Paenibacillus ginsengarvi]|uniref:ABC transporter ATP-binding protein n=1 Tax=Paenibacillus ginsengarvi TaxID=400777 RepID=UPI0013159275|nr:ABC transporter ATP-binding protein [Paenibacillus ginsengarvi]